MLTHIFMILTLIVILILTFDDVVLENLDDSDKIGLSMIVIGVFVAVGAILL